MKRDDFSLLYLTAVGGPAADGLPREREGVTHTTTRRSGEQFGDLRPPQAIAGPGTTLA